ncbi:MAG: hypothetical protein ABR584_00155 [Candidatus Baltobacteraceae bacterium]
MEEIVGIKVRTTEGREFGFMTWGRIFHAVDNAISLKPCAAVQKLVRAPKMSILSKCADHYEAFRRRCTSTKPYSTLVSAPLHTSGNTKKWRKQRSEEMKDADDIYFLDEVFD